MARRLLATAALAVLASLAPASPALGAWTWPLRGAVITPYLNGDDPYAAGQHRGVDIAGPVGAPVVSAAAGLVRFAGTAGSSGLTVSVRTGDGRLDLSYLHLSALAVNAGERVALGARIGAVGTTGRRAAVAPHLHFGVRDAGSAHGYHDPLAFLPPPGSPAPPAPRPVPVRVPVAQRPAPTPRVPGPIPAVRLRRPDPVRSPRLGPAPAPIPLVPRAPATTVAPRGQRHGLDLGWPAACAGALGASLALLTARGRARRRRSPGRLRRPTSSIVIRALLRHHADLLRER
jgi:hypothetical protein